MLSAFRCQPVESLFFLQLNSLSFKMKAQVSYSEGSQFETRALGISFVSPRSFFLRLLLRFISLKESIRVPMKSPYSMAVFHENVI